MSDDQMRPYDWFRNIVALSQGADWHAAEAERAACCVVVPEIVGPRKDEDTARMRQAALRHANTAMHYAIASGAYLSRLATMAKETEYAAGHLRNAKFHIEKSIAAEQRAKDAVEAMNGLLAGEDAAHPVCHVAGL
jgi:hypothetical protein